MPLVSQAMNKNGDVRERVVAVDEVTFYGTPVSSGKHAQETMAWPGRRRGTTHVRNGIASLPLFLGTVNGASWSLTM